MKTILKLTTLSAILLSLIGGVVSCTKPFPEPFPPAGTKWKLEGINYQDGQGVIMLEPKDCDTCYTFVFDTDSTAFGISIINQIKLFRPYRSGSPAITTMSEFEEPFDGDLYCALLKHIHSIVIDRESLVIQLKVNEKTQVLIYNPF